ncbi:hypothetical protein J2X48_000872 [Bosea sp. BE271]|uniref:hypothetical protein n=1 Tax=Bosea TaxID=85413 RepID=UPI002855D28A|nr:MULTISPECIES: hypothetical protein [Bosea]MDR6826326.1 hypothetical protein [Bosea robiniae]MDR6893036.1 hypothetical protein [Bosea sp. BE109]MDR7137266.1 hypothetical protein [Bosea sp. BE168]MDR7173966.1 hypothetical protein [Bosea sp. BE271]
MNQPLDRRGASRQEPARSITIRRRNQIVLILLLAFVGFTFAMGIRHVAREVGGISSKS